MHNSIPYGQATKKFSLSEKVGQLFMPAAFINDSEEEVQALEGLIRRHHIGGICFFHSRASAATNFEGKKEVLYNENSLETLKTLIVRYQKASDHPLLVAIDAEWGLAMRIENTPQYPYAVTLGAVQEHNDLIFEVGRNIARDCKAAGIHWNLAPVVDVNSNPNNPVIGYRSFGTDKNLIVEKAIAYLKGTQSEGILTSAKHFPGHGDTATDSHLGLPVISKSKSDLWENELLPFRAIINEGIDSIMVGHLCVPVLANGQHTPSSLSKEMIKGILREEMGFKGVVISDALNMRAVSSHYPKKGELEWRAFDAGNDMLCFAEHTKEGIETILKNATESQIEESFQRIWKLKEKAIQGTGSSPNPENGDGLNKRLAQESLTFLKGSKEDIATFRDSNFIGISIIDNIENHFFKSIHKNNPFKYTSLSHRQKYGSEKEMVTTEDILLAIFPPQVKPANNFGFSNEQVNFINSLVQSKKNVILYLFGNPYFLNRIHIENIKAVVIAYQNFKVFQEIAAEHFLGNLEANGKLPITLEIK